MCVCGGVITECYRINSGCSHFRRFVHGLCAACNCFVTTQIMGAILFWFEYTEKTIWMLDRNQCDSKSYDVNARRPESYQDVKVSYLVATYCTETSRLSYL